MNEIRHELNIYNPAEFFASLCVLMSARTLQITEMSSRNLDHHRQDLLHRCHCMTQSKFQLLSASL